VVVTHEQDIHAILLVQKPHECLSGEVLYGGEIQTDEVVNARLRQPFQPFVGRRKQGGRLTRKDHLGVLAEGHNGRFASLAARGFTELGEQKLMPLVHPVKESYGSGNFQFLIFHFQFSRSE
jgi:hypothetical protein